MSLSLCLAVLYRGSEITQTAIVVLTLISLLHWNLDSNFDIWAVYFLGAYGLGMMAWWVTHDQSIKIRWFWQAVMITLILLALAVEWRDRIALAGATALLLVWCQTLNWPSLVSRAIFMPLQRLGQISYSVFLIHFGVSLLVNAIIYGLWPTSVQANLMGVLAAVMLSVWAGAVLHRWVEVRSLGWFTFGPAASSTGRVKNKA